MPWLPPPFTVLDSHSFSPIDFNINLPSSPPFAYHFLFWDLQTSPTSFYPTPPTILARATQISCVLHPSYIDILSPHFWGLVSSTLHCLWISIHIDIDFYHSPYPTDLPFKKSPDSVTRSVDYLLVCLLLILLYPSGCALFYTPFQPLDFFDKPLGL